MKYYVYGVLDGMNIPVTSYFYIDLETVIHNIETLPRHDLSLYYIKDENHNICVKIEKFSIFKTWR